MSNTTAKSTILVENDPDLSNLIAHQTPKPLEYPEQVIGLEQLRKLVHVVQSPIRNLTLPNDLPLAGKMGRMIGKQKQALESIQTVLYNRLPLATEPDSFQPGGTLLANLMAHLCQNPTLY
jgi:hypothetical protein